MFLRYFIAIQLLSLKFLFCSSSPEEYAEPQFRKSRDIPKLNLSLPKLVKALSDEDLSNIKALSVEEKKKIGLNEDASEFNPSWLTRKSDKDVLQFSEVSKKEEGLFPEPVSSRPKSKKGPTFEELKRYLPPCDRKKQPSGKNLLEKLELSDDSDSGSDFDEQSIQPVYPKDRIFVSKGVTRIEFGTMMESVPEKPNKGRCPLPLAPKKQ